MDAPLKIGLVGLDTSHCVAFTQLLQDAADPYHVAGGRVTGLFVGGSPALAVSRERVQGFSQELQSRYGLPVYDSLAELAQAVDALLLLSGDGRQHLEQFQAVAVGKPVFVDKPLATSSAEARALLKLAAQTGTPVMSCSALRFADGLAEPLPLGEHVLACEIYGPATVLPDFPGLFWYGVHGIDSLFAWMGAGCQRVRCLAHPAQDVLVGEWAGGRLGVFRGTRLATSAFGGVLHTTGQVLARQARHETPLYYRLVQQILAFFRSRRAPLAAEEMFAVIAFIEAAHASAQQGGAAVELALL
jgi:hypothetical protein